MRRLSFFLYFLIFIVSTSYAQEQVITETTIMSEDSEITHYLYDDQARPFMRLKDGITQTVLTYNELNQVVRKDSIILGESGFTRSYVYTYNEAGQKATEEEFMGERSNGTTTFTYDEHGNCTSMTSSRTGLPIPVRNTYDEAAHLIKTEVMNPMEPTQAMVSTEYTYEGELVVKELNCSGEDTTSIVLHTYNETGLLIKTITTDKDDEVISTTTYAYADIDVSFAPYNVQATAGDGNSIVVTWEGAANSAVVDGKFYTVTGNTFTTPVLVDGTYIVYIVNNGNATASSSLDIADNTKVGVSDVHLDGEISANIVLEENRDGEMVPVTYYNIPVAWTLPAGAKPTGYRIYYNSTYYVDVEDGTLRNYVIPAKNITIYNPSTWSVVTLDFVIRVVAIYDTGEMEPANTLTLDTEAILALSVKAAQETLGTTEVFTLDGIRLPSQGNLRPGTYIFRHGKATRKVQTR